MFHPSESVVIPADSSEDALCSPANNLSSPGMKDISGATLLWRVPKLFCTGLLPRIVGTALLPKAWHVEFPPATPTTGKAHVLLSSVLCESSISFKELLQKCMGAVDAKNSVRRIVFGLCPANFSVNKSERTCGLECSCWKVNRPWKFCIVSVDECESRIK